MPQLGNLNKHSFDPVSGSIVSWPDSTADILIVIDNSATLATLTIPFKADPIDGQLMLISVRSAITALTLTSVKPIRGAATSLAGECIVGWIFDTARDAWFIYYPYKMNKAQVGLGNVDNTSDLQKPISTAAQTAISSIQAPATVPGYTLSVQALTSSPADGATIYFGNMPKAAITTPAVSKIYIRQAGTIKRAEIYCYSGTAGSNEAWALHIRKNNTTDTLVATLSVSANERVFSNTNLNIVMAAGDYFEIKAVNPTWGTNPLTTIWGGYIYIE